MKHRCTAETEEMAETLGTFIRERRIAAKMTLRRLAAQAGISPSALCKWESDTVQPRIPELDMVLDALGCSDASRRQAYAYINAPRAMARLRQAAPSGQTTPSEKDAPRPDHAAWFPSSGSLLRSLRLRRHLSLEQAAALLSVQPSTISRWEASRSAVSETHLDTYCTVLSAEAEERQALKTLFLDLPRSQAPAPSVEQLEQNLDRLQKDVIGGEIRLMELRFFSLESLLWHLTTDRPAVHRLLAMTYTWHAQWLHWRERLPEAGQIADRTLRLVEEWDRPESYWFRAVYIYAAYLASGMKRSSLLRGTQFVQDWLPAATSPETEAWLRHTVASYAMRAGQKEDALKIAFQASAATARSERLTAIRLASCDNAAILVQAGHHEEALSLLPAECHRNAHHQAFHASIWTAALLGLGEEQEAYTWYQRACKIVRENHLSSSRYTAMYAARLGPPESPD
jgi:transcriptional regulator with XRE-family HTH domain